MFSPLRFLACLAFAALPASVETRSAESTNQGNRLTCLDSDDPFYPNKDFPKLITPQWVGEPGVDAVVILAIDDMRDSAKYEQFLRPILNRLKQIDGRAPVSIFANVVKPDDPQLQMWLKEGLSLEVHTLAHPCPLLQKGSFTNAWNTYHGCVDLLNQVPGNKPVAFRMPCCDSMNSPSPRFYAEIFNRASPTGNFLQIDSSVMCLLTDPSPSPPGARGQANESPRNTSSTSATPPPHPQSLFPEGGEGSRSDRFRKYFPTQTNAITKKSLANFATYIEDYPYPYVINKVCWEFPAMVPSDWEAFNAQGPTNAVTLADWKAALDIVVQKQGVFTWIFHPHGWSSPEMINAFIDYAVEKHGKKVKFLTFNEALERLNRNFLNGQSLRQTTGSPSGVGIFDQDVVSPKGGVKIGTRKPDGVSGPGLQLRDMDHDGIPEWILANPQQQAVFAWSEGEKQWKKLPDATWPAGVSILNEQGEDNGVRFVDVNGDGYQDLLYSNEKEFGLWLYIANPVKNLGWEKGWTYKVREGKRKPSDTLSPSGERAGVRGRSVPNDIPPIVRAGPHRNNGVWFRDGAMWVQNEDTAHLSDVVQRIPFSELLTGGEQPASSPEQELASFDVRPGFQVELVASEPLVFDPVAYEWGADGRLWVVEMADYPLGMDGKGKSGGRVVILTDTDGDGHYDKRTVFLDGLNFPNGVMPWRKGVLISAAPDILYAEDRDGDGKADLKKVLFTGFVEGNQQHRINGFDYGLDGWVYAANGDSGGVIKPVAGVLTEPKNTEPLDIRAYDIRFNPDTGEIQPVAGRTQFGRHRDDWGNWFGNNNPTWLWHYHIPIEYLKRNPYLSVPSVRTVLSNYDHANRVFTVGQQQRRFNWADRVSETTSANSAMPYRDDLFGPDFATSVFISEPANNVVHREVLEPDGVTFKSHRAADEQDREFLASSDNWFRPTMLKTGPDGALYIADMYRRILEHPQYFPEEMRHRPDIRAGEDKGRIWRVYPKGAKLRKVPNLAKLTGTNLVAAMDSPNGWQRETVQRLLVLAFGNALGDEKERYAIFRDLLVMTTKENPKVRLQTYSTIQSLGSGRFPNKLGELVESPAVMNYAAADRHPIIRAFSMMHAEDTAVLDGARDEDVRVRYASAFRLGSVARGAAVVALAELAGHESNDPNMQTAILSSAPSHLKDLLPSIVVQASRNQDGMSASAGLLRQLLSLAVAEDNVQAIKVSLVLLLSDHGNGYAEWQVDGLGGFVEAAAGSRKTLAQFAAYSSLDVRPLFVQMRHWAEDSTRKESSRAKAIRLLGYEPSQAELDLKTLGFLLKPEQPQQIQKAALDAIKGVRLPNAAETMLAGWKSHGPAMRGDVLNALFTRGEWTQVLLKAIEDGSVSPGEINASQRQKLLSHSSSSIRERAQKLFAITNTDRQAVVKKFAIVADLKGDAARGATLFGTTCATCHHLKGQGSKVGPDLGTMADKSVQSMLTAMLDPSAAIDAAYTSYSLTTKDGREFAGILAAETPNSLTIRMPGGTEETVLRAQIGAFRANTLSLMPEGLETTLQPQNMADIIAYVLKP